MSRSLFRCGVLLLSSSCAVKYAAVPPPGAQPLRHQLGTRAPRALHPVLGGVELAVHDSDPGGSRPTLLCLHAIGHGGGDFSALEDALGDRFRIVTVDWPGHGFSGPDAAPASARRYTELLAALLDALKLERVVIVGNSIGGAVAMRYAAAHPEQVRGLVLANPGGLDPGGWLPNLYMGWLVGHFEQGQRREAAFEAWFSGFYDGILITPEAAARKRAIVAAGYESANVLTQAWESFREPEADLRPLIPQLTMPVLFTWAKEDGLIRWSRNREAVERFPNATVEMFEAGHTPFLESPEPFNRSLLAFLRRLDAP